jgi:tape measure domain-containing protein
MTNIAEYTLSLNDKLSAKMKAIGVNSDSALQKFAELQRKANSTSKTMNEMGRSVSTLRDKLSLLKAERDLIPEKSITAIRKYNAEIAKLTNHINILETTGGSRISSAFGRAFQQIPYSNLITNPIVLAGAAGFKAITAGVENERVLVAFDVMLGGEDKAKVFAKAIRDYADITPYTNSALQEAGKLLLNYGVSADKVLPFLKNIGSIAAGDSNKMSSLTLAFSQVAATGRLMGQDLNQMVNAGFNPLQEISRKTGKSMGQLKKEMEQGKIPFSMVASAFQSVTEEGGRFHGMTEKMSQTVGGKWSTLMDQMETGFLKIYEIIRPILIPTIDFLSRVFGKLISGFKKAHEFGGHFFKLFQEGNSGVMWFTAIVGSLLTVLVAYKTIMFLITTGTKLWAFAQGVLNSIMAINPVVLIIAGIVALIALIAFVIYKTDGWGKTWKNTMEYMKLTFQQFGAFLNLKWLQVQDVFMTGFETIQKGWYKLQSLWDKEAAAKGLKSIEDKRNERAEEILKAQNKVKELSKARSEMKIWEVKWNGKKLKDVTKGIKSKLGIEPVEVVKPGGTGEGSPEGIAAGGTRNTSISITLKNLVENIYFEGSINENKDDLIKQVEEALIRVLYSAQSAV